MATRRRILLIDADSADRALSALVLSHGPDPPEVDGVGDAAGFAERLARGRFDLAITEHRLGWSDGPSVVGAIKGLYPDRQVVLLSADAGPEVLSAALRKGLDAFLPKTSAGLLELAPLVAGLLARGVGGGARRPGVQTATAATEAAGASEATADAEPAGSATDLERIAHVVSHDLQAPLQLVTRYARLLDERYGDKLGDKGGGFLQHLLTSADRMQQMIDDLLEFARVGSKGRPFTEVALDEALDEALDNLAAAVDENAARITHDPLPTVTADHSQMVRLLQNLIGNAIKFHGNTPPRVHVKAVENGGAWLLSVDDNGIGIAEDDQRRIFEMFQRLHSESEYPGTGVGLTICKRIAERHGGSIAVESEPGKGSTFYVRLPKSPGEG